MEHNTISKPATAVTMVSTDQTAENPVMKPHTMDMYDGPVDYMKVDEPEHLPYLQTYEMDWIAGYNSGQVFTMNDMWILKRVAMSLHWRDSACDLARERIMYKRLGEHPRILTLVCPCQNGLMFERMVESVKMRLRLPLEAPRKSTHEQSLRWCIQAAESLAYVHSRDIRQSDISCNNFLLDRNDDIKICDFGGSQIDGGEYTSCSSTCGEGPDVDYRWQAGDGAIPVVQELFGLASVMYEMWTSRTPYEGEENHFIVEQFRARHFPQDVVDIPVGEVILGCWNAKYSTADEVVTALRAIKEPSAGKSDHNGVSLPKEVSQEIEDVAQDHSNYPSLPLLTSRCLSVIVATIAILGLAAHRALYPSN